MFVHEERSIKFLKHIEYVALADISLDTYLSLHPSALTEIHPPRMQGTGQAK